MTRLLYHSDSYIQKFEAIVVEVDQENQALVLDETAFYPGGGGQPADTGKIFIENSEITINRVKKIGEKVFHYLTDSDQLPAVGSHVQCSLDWERRFQLMRTHTAMHILCGVIFRDYGASVTGGDMQPLKGRMDFEFETMQKELVKDIENAINIEVDNQRLVKVNILPRKEAFKIPDLIRTKINLLPEGISEVRVVEIVGLDLQADGGTHVNNTSEVGIIHVTDYMSKGKINKRIYVELDP